MATSLEASRLTVEQTRLARQGQTMPLQAGEAKERLLNTHHPDYREDAYRPLRIGPNTGERTVHELAALLEGDSPVPTDLTLTARYATDVLVIGAGGAGHTAALAARQAGARVLLATKLRLGDSNTVMAEGGMQVAVGADDSPVTHFLDTMKGGHMKNDPQLVRILVEEGPAAAQWLTDLGVIFDRETNGNLRLKSGGAASKARLLTCRDYTGLEMMRVLKDCVVNEEIEVLEFSPAVELLSHPDGSCAGAVLKNLDTNEFVVVSAKTVILATGGSGRLHIQGFPTSNHFGATGDGLCLAYRLGAPLHLHDTFQYHPTGAVHPEPMVGLLVTEALRSSGAQLVNALGRQFVNEGDLRDVVASAVLRECREGRGVTTPTGRQGVWLDIPLVDLLHGETTIEKRFPNMLRLFSRYSMDIRKEPALIYPTLHYQNGGVRIDANSESPVRNLFVVGETSGGVHGRNRLMGNSLLELIVFGRRAGRVAGQRAKAAGAGSPPTLGHLKKFRDEMKRAGTGAAVTSPMLLPNYVRKQEATETTSR